MPTKRKPNNGNGERIKIHERVAKLEEGRLSLCKDIKEIKEIQNKIFTKIDELSIVAAVNKTKLGIIGAVAGLLGGGIVTAIIMVLKKL